MNTQAYMILHYCKDYAGWSIKSVYNHVEKIHVLYSPTPTHGTLTLIPCPDTREELKKAIKSNDPFNKVIWHEVSNITHEGPHRDLAVDICRRYGADVVLVVDNDEIWPHATLSNALREVEKTEKRNFLINFTHLWRSFNHCCKDDGWPVRFIRLDQRKGTHYIPRELGEIYHFGYAINDDLMNYKWLIHGHIRELRPNWFKDKWNNWVFGVEDVHPTNEKNFWIPEPFDKARLPNFMKEHPYYNLEIIK